MNGKVGQEINASADLPSIHAALESAHELFVSLRNESSNNGVITTKTDTRTNPLTGESESLEMYMEFHPILFKQHEQGLPV